MSLKEVNDSEKILCRTLLKENIDFFLNEDLHRQIDPQLMDDLALALKSAEIQEATLTSESNDVALVVAGYVAKMLATKADCKDCHNVLTSHEVAENSYFENLSRGGLTVPSQALADYVSNGFAILDSIDHLLLQHPVVPIRDAADYALSTYSNNIDFMCENHVEWGGIKSRKIIINIFYNNKKKLQNDAVRVEALKAFKRRQREK